MNATQTKKYSVALSAHGNPDRWQDPSMEVAPGGFVGADSVEECQSIVRRYIDAHCIGGGNWTGGNVYEHGVKIGHISYNGRYWPLES